MIKAFPRTAALLLAALATPLNAAPLNAAPQHHPRPIATRQVPAPAVVRPALWKLADGDTTIWLFGTVHALPKGVAWYEGAVANAFEGVDALVTEIVEQSPEEMRPLVASKAMLPEGQNLRDMLSPRERKAYEAALAADHLPPAALDRYQPWYAAVALSTIPLMSGGFDPANGVDTQLSEKERARGRPHQALETAAYQLGLFAGLPMAVQRKYLRQVVQNLPSIRSELAQIIAAWKVGNAAKLARLMNADEDDPALRNTLLIGRNRAWAEWIKARMARPGSVFIAVGAGHLAGADSVQDQLRALGFNVTRIQ